MHVVFLNPVGVVGGAERVLLASVDAVRQQFPNSRLSAILLGPGPLENALRSRGVRVEVLSLPSMLSRAGDTQLRSARSLVHLLHLPKSAWLAAPTALQFLRRFRRILQQLQPTVVHSNGLKSHLLLQMLSSNRVPVIWHIHDFYSQRPLVARLLRWRRTGSVACAIAISEAVRTDTLTILPKMPIAVVRNGVDLLQFSPGECDGQDLDRLSGLQLKSNVVRIGLVATYANWKGHEVFLRALAQVPKAVGYVVGGPIYSTMGSQTSLKQLQSLAQSLGISNRVGFVPFQAEPTDIYRMLDVVVHASTRAEPFGLTIAEAMACGRAVIVSRAGGAAELVTEGVNALCHPPGNVELLANAMHRLVQDADLRARLGIEARRTAVKDFGLERYAKELAQVYKSLKY